ncbi:hypothetical protein M433DRAFT_70154 [Acidomyces richmondensis BFW]|nr:MAG: hypothetical protein FE78DRAFT_152431 [Acidomyces sp. 'richmondensis']KYG44121.1 hypothetical protein M433DRAFT_70154 [Acidomyces richmondensis BFW]
MATRIASFRSLSYELAKALSSFQSSGSKFRVLKTVTSSNLQPEDPKPPACGQSPKTLFILDSSFNPPTVAHQSMAQSALTRSFSDAFPRPHRLLLLFATMNADKAPSAASFAQRLTLMTILASELLASIEDNPDDYSMVPIDVGVTNVPYYTDKSAAISSEAKDCYPDSPKHIHLIGFDTFTRIFDPKYYMSFSPPFSALSPYFDAGHRLRVTLRPDQEQDSIAGQVAFIKRLEDGNMEKDGGMRSWAQQVDFVLPNKNVGVSSTKVRKTAMAGQWQEVRKLCPPTVAEYVKMERLYLAVDQESK